MFQVSGSQTKLNNYLKPFLCEPLHREIKLILIYHCNKLIGFGENTFKLDKQRDLGVRITNPSANLPS